MFSTWTILLVFATILTIISFRNKNILLSLGATIGWFSLMAFNLNNPLVGIAQGSTIHQWLTMGLIAIGIAVMLMYFRNRGRATDYHGDMESYYRGEAGGWDRPAPPPSEQKGLMEMTPSEYRQRVHRSVNRGARLRAEQRVIKRRR